MGDVDQDYKERIKKYSLDELVEVSQTIDGESYPARYQYVMERISEIKSALAEQRSRDPRMDAARPGVQEPVEQSIIDEITGKSKSSRNTLQNLAALVLTLVVFAGLGLFSWKPVDLVILIVVLLVHESGHFLFMKVFKYHDVKMFFIPLFGAATSGREIHPNATKQAVVSLAGPLPGIGIGFGLAIAYVITKNVLYYQAAMLFVSINAFNLLPLYPLDGGRFFESVLFSRHPVLETVFKFITSFLLGLIGFALHAWLLLPIALLMLISLRIDYRIADTAKKIRADVANGILPDFPLTGESLGIIRDRLGPEIIRPNLSKKNTGAILYRVWQRTHLVAPRFLMSAFLLVIFAGSFLFTIVAFGVTVYAKHNVGVEQKIVMTKAIDGSMGGVEIATKDGTVRSRRHVDLLNCYDGECCVYYTDGAVKTIGRYNAGKRDGPWVDLAPNGDTISIEKFDKGRFLSYRKKRNGTWVEKGYGDLSSMEKWAYDLEYKAKAQHSWVKKIEVVNELK